MATRTGSTRPKGETGGKGAASQNESAAASATPVAAGRFPIVGLGTSAGGLEAFEEFLHAMPADSGMGFVLLQHLDPSHASLLTEILQRSTGMPVVEEQDPRTVER